MRPITFKEKNRTLQRPPTMTADECVPLDVWTDGRQCVSCWRPSLVERIMILLFGKVWIFVYSGSTQPPVSVLGARTAFTRRKIDDRR